MSGISTLPPPKWEPQGLWGIESWGVHSHLHCSLLGCLGQPYAHSWAKWGPGPLAIGKPWKVSSASSQSVRTKQSGRAGDMQSWGHGVKSGVRRQKAWAHCEVLRIQLREESDHQGTDTFTHSEVTASSLVTLQPTVCSTRQFLGSTAYMAHAEQLLCTPNSALK